MSLLNPPPIHFPFNNANPSYGMDYVLRNLVHDPDVLGAAVYTVARNGSTCTGIKQASFTYDGNGPIPVSTLRAVPVKHGIKEFLGYLFGFTSIAQFNSIGIHTWDKDANQNESWLTNPNRKGEGDIGEVYGALARNLKGPNGETKDLIKEQIEQLRAGNYNRRNIINWYDPFVRGALPACMYEHAFTVHNGYLNITSSQRSNDSGLGGAVNPLQSYFFMHLVAKMTGYKPGWVLHTVHDLHIYSNQIEAIKEFIDNEPKPATGRLILSDKIGIHTTLEDLEAMDINEIFTIEDYVSNGKYHIPLTV